MKNNIKIILAILLGLSALVAIPAYAAVSSTTQGAKAAEREAGRMERIKNATTREIDRRVTALGELSTRIGEMKHISDADKASLKSTIDTQVAELTALKAKITADTDLATLKTDAQSVTKSYRIFALVMPRAHITAAADRVLSIVTDMSTLGGKLQTRITEASGKGADITKLSATLADFNAKVADAKTQAEGAVSGITALTPDNGDKTKMDANTAALKAARAKIKTAMEDLKAARADVKTIVEGLKALKLPATASSTTN
jgi:TolA-binding protein